MITKEQFLKYNNIRDSGVYNMIMNADIVMKLINLTKQQYYDIIVNYSLYYYLYVEKNISINLFNEFKDIIYNIILKYKIDINPIKKLIILHNYEVDDIFYFLDSPTWYPSSKYEIYADLKFILDETFEVIEKNSKYQDIDQDKLYNYFKINIFELLNTL